MPKNIKFQYPYPFSRQKEIKTFLDEKNYKGCATGENLKRRDNTINNGKIVNGNSTSHISLRSGRGTCISFNVFKYILQLV